MLDERTVVVEAAEQPMMDFLRSLGCDVIPCPFDRVYPFGGGFHCCTADIRRQGTLQSYFPSLDRLSRAVYNSAVANSGRPFTRMSTSCRYFRAPAAETVMPSPGASGAAISPFASGVRWLAVISTASGFGIAGYSQMR